MSKVRVTISIDAAIRDKLADAAKAERRSLSSLLEVIAEAWLAQNKTS